jgi:hypothetical protein
MVVSRLIKVVSVKGLPAHLRSNISMQYRCVRARGEARVCVLAKNSMPGT